MIFDWLCGSDRFSTHEKWSVILKSSETQSKIINPPLREIHLFPHSFAKSRKLLPDRRDIPVPPEYGKVENHH
jgi:hypothetical protein